jgi:hypothetical protein
MGASNDALSNPPDADQQAEFERQIELLVTQHKSYPCIVTWVIYNEGWGQRTQGYYPEISITERIRALDPIRLIDATTGWWDHGVGDFSVCSFLVPFNISCPRLRSDLQSLVIIATDTLRTGQPSLRRPTVWHPVLLHQLVSLRPHTHRIPGGVWRPRSQAISREVSIQYVRERK